MCLKNTRVSFSRNHATDSIISAVNDLAIVSNVNDGSTSSKRRAPKEKFGALDAKVPEQDRPKDSPTAFGAMRSMRLPADILSGITFSDTYTSAGGIVTVMKVEPTVQEAGIPVFVGDKLWAVDQQWPCTALPTDLQNKDLHFVEGILPRLMEAYAVV